MTRASKVKLAEETPGDALPWAGAPPVSVQQLWIAVQRQEWSSLVVMPSGPEGSAYEVARILHTVGKLTMGDRLRLLDGRGVKLAGTAPLILEMTGSSPVRPASDSRGDRVLVVIDWVLAQPSGIPIALAADAAVLCVDLGRTSVAEARETIQVVGPQRFVGCVTLSPP
jgi:hypothetical protein